MSKERLEEVVKNVVFNECGITGAPMSVELPEDDYWYLKEQAERVQNLEERLKRQIERNWDKERLSELLPDTIYYIDKLKEEIKNLERRLEEQIESNRMYMWKNNRYREALVKLRNDIGKIKTWYEKNVFVIKTVDDALIDWEALEGKK